MAHRSTRSARRWWRDLHWLSTLNLLGRSEPSFPVVVDITDASVTASTTLTIPNVLVSKGSSKLFVFVFAVDSVLSERTVTSVTHDGIAMTLVATSPTDDAGTNRIEIWELDDPSAGFFDVLVTMGGEASVIVASAVTVDKFGIQGDLGNDFLINNTAHTFNIELDDHSLYLVGVGLNSASSPNDSGGILTLKESVILSLFRLRISVFNSYPGGLKVVGWVGAASSTDWVSSSIEIKLS